MTVEWKPKPSLPAPILERGVLRWMMKNLFSSPFNVLLTLAGIAIILLVVPPFIRWALFDAAWIGNSRGACDQMKEAGGAGACWVFIRVRFGLFLYGFYPGPERWRVNMAFIILILSLFPILAGAFSRHEKIEAAFSGLGVLAVFLLFGLAPGLFTLFYLLAPYALPHASLRRVFVTSDRAAISLLIRGTILAIWFLLAYVTVGRLGVAPAAGSISLLAALLALPLIFSNGLPVMVWRWIFLFTVYPVFAYYVLLGGVFGLPEVQTHYWGGLFLTLVVAGVGMATALPIGILLALGRRSDMPVIKTLCIAFIELVRGVPLVSVLFMASVMFPLFLPEEVYFDKLLRALVGVSLFYAAYIAEVVRGGLQAIPKGQYEAAKALGWPYWKMMGLIILPQALRLVIPGLANNFLSLLKDTTLVAVIGLMDVLGIVKAAMADVEWIGFVAEAYVFAAVLFWIFCFGISRYSMRLEKKYHVNYR